MAKVVGMGQYYPNASLQTGGIYHPASNFNFRRPGEPTGYRNYGQRPAFGTEGDAFTLPSERTVNAPVVVIDSSTANADCQRLMWVAPLAAWFGGILSSWLTRHLPSPAEIARGIQSARKIVTHL